ncbi:MAG: type II toxin-antitoxin system VapC family toxin [Rhizomicrobium sp.]
MYLIDTDVLSELRKPRPNGNVLDWMSRRNPAELFISAITVMEIERGIQKQRGANPDHANILEEWLLKNLTQYGERVLAITSQVARRWGRMQIQLQRDDDDIAIAAIALEHNLTVVTRNVRHFDKTGVAILNPFDAA